MCRNQMNGLALSLPFSGPKKDMEEEIVLEESEKTELIESVEENREDTPTEKPCGGPAKNSNLRIMTSRHRPTLRSIFTMGKEPRIDGKVRPSTAVATSSATSFVPPPLQRGETVPALRSIMTMSEITHDNEDHDKKVSGGYITDDPQCNRKYTVVYSDAESDIDLRDILECSHKSMAVVRF
ncbi:hypothetical protein ANCCAN_00002 [Ancylostoma caninum]|uniref:Uncharacterized protein n=1 Tax=Ancylostoma caninum TaxID=29170 RepID=A0A368HCZ5_ANCCA|nr:hypothetical protein ANCCAN_00002 [Ancylostoma caninum]